ncbi:uncharacterized protein LOC129609224 [Condylostylus longicornis]|uniref:uncharacterized protein LOC129609224 n=1 Tax=Condylostylus longicornis TaxID=2530218 RepID=UPI00244E49CD|nr:uncharacterized protein LOC129609224 [Condylostylus longicornis]
MVNNKETSIEFRELIIKYHLEGFSLNEIAKIIKRSKSTVQYIVQNFKKTGSVNYNKKSGGPRKLNEREERHILHEIKKNPKMSGTTIAKRVSQTYKKDVSNRTIQRLLNRNGFHAYTPRKKPLISDNNKKKRLEFAKSHNNSDLAY